MDDLPWIPGPYKLVHEFQVQENSAVEIDACYSAFHAGMGLRALMGTFRVRAHSVQCRILEMQGMPRHLMIRDDACDQHFVIFESPETGDEIGRVVNLYTPS